MKVLLDKDVYDKVMYWVKKAGTKEISGLGTLKVEGDSFRVMSAMLLPQKNGPTHTDIESDAVCKALYELRNEEGDLKWWWHSHVDMAVFWSGTDHATIKSFGDGGWIVATVFNKKAEKKSAFYSRDGKVTPFGVDYLFVDDLPTTIAGELLVQQDWDAEYEKNVTAFESVVTIPARTSYDENTMYDDDGYWANGVWRPYQTGFPIHMAPRDNSTGKFVSRKAVPEKVAHFQTKAEKRLLKKQARQAQKAVAKSVDSYGFSQVDWNALSECGYDIHDVDVLVADGFTPAQIVSLANDGVDADEALELLVNGFTHADIVGRTRSFNSREVQ